MVGDGYTGEHLAENLSGSLRPDKLSDEELGAYIVLAQLVLAKMEPKLPVQAMFICLAQAVLELRDRLYQATGVQ